MADISGYIYGMWIYKGAKLFTERIKILKVAGNKLIMQNTIY